MDWLQWPDEIENFIHIESFETLTLLDRVFGMSKF